MPAYNFKKEFVVKLLDGDKIQTIRKKRKYPTKIGDTLYLYTGLRSKDSRLLRTVKCSSMADVVIDRDGVRFDGMMLHPLSAERLAVDDGFDTLEEMMDFFERVHGLPFEGEVIFWDLQDDAKPLNDGG